jgi:hypothetical protein
MTKIFVQTGDQAFPGKLKRLCGDTEVIVACVYPDEIKRFPGRGDILFIDRMPFRDFCDPATKVVVMASRYSRRKEFMAARAGARGFITTDIPDAVLKKAIGRLAAGEIWMTRETVAMVFEEYVKLMARKTASAGYPVPAHEVFSY